MSDYERKEVSTTTDKGRIGKLWDTLQASIKQNVETVTRQSRFEISGGGVDQIDAPDDLDELVDLAKQIGFLYRAFDIFATDVWEPGYRLEGPDQTVAYFMGEMEDLDVSPPEDTPEGGFLKNSAVFAGEKHQDFYDIAKATTKQRRLRGTVLVEYLKADSEDAESELTGFYLIRPETISAEVYPNTNILIDPEDTDADGVEITKRGEAAAYIQFDDNSILGRRGNFTNKDEIPLSQNDVHKFVYSPGIGDDPSEEQGVFGTSMLRPISDDMAEFRNIKRDRATAISNKAHGIWLIEHGREVIETPNGYEVIEWDDESMDDFEKSLDDVGPGGWLTYDGSVDVERLDGDVPDLSSVMQEYRNELISATPVPKYKIGFEDNINRDVTSEQAGDTNYERDVREEREYMERQWTKALRKVANRKGLDTEGLQLKIEPEPEDSPVKSLSQAEIDKFTSYAQGLATLAGQGGPQTLVDSETLIEDIAQLSMASEEETLEDIGFNEEDAEAFHDILQRDTYQAFEDGSVVDTPDGIGVIDDIITEGTVDDQEASEDEPIYAVVVEDEDVGVGFYTEDDLSSASVDDIPGPDNPESDVEEETDTESNDTYQEGFFEWPQSWVDSPQPARLIALKAWAGMGGSFDGCVREMRGNIVSPDRFCADFKDRLYGREDWRGGWAD